MKLNIQKLQAGGGLGMLFSAVADPSSNAAQQTAQQSSSSKKDSSDDGILSKEVLNELRKHGLPNEVDQFEKVLAQLEDRIASGRGISSSQLASVRSMANRIIKHSSYLDTAISTAKDNKALGDTAVDRDGFIYATDQDGKLQKVAFNKFDTSKYNALSYAELAEYRRNSPDLINNSDIIKTIQSGIGSEKINDFIQGILSKIGQSETKQEAYESIASIQGINPKTISNQELSALQSVAEAAQQIGLDSIFKTEQFRKNSNVQLAMQYIMSILPQQMRAQLQGSYIAQGGSYKDSRIYAAQVIQTASLAAADNAYHFGIDYSASANKAAGTSSKDPSQTRNLTNLEQLIMGSLGKIDFNLTGSKNADWNIQLHGTGSGWLADANNNKVSTSPMSLALETGLGGLIDYNHIYAGNQKVDQAMLDSILYNGRGAINVWVPTDGNGNINWTLLTQYHQMLERFNQDSKLTPEDKQQLLAQIGINGTIDDNGNFVGNDPRMERFIVVTGITSDQIIDPDENSFADILNKDNKKYWFDVIHRIYGNINKGIKGKDNKMQFATDWTEWGTDLISTPIFMRVNKTAKFDVGTLSDHGPLVSTKTYGEQISADQASDAYKPSTSILFNE